jgi:hypothetical protein
VHKTRFGRSELREVVDQQLLIRTRFPNHSFSESFPYLGVIVDLAPGAFTGTCQEELALLLLDPVDTLEKLQRILEVSSSFTIAGFYELFLPHTRSRQYAQEALKMLRFKFSEKVGPFV